MIPIRLRLLLTVCVDVCVGMYVHASDTHYESQTQHTALHWAAYKGMMQTVKYLCEECNAIIGTKARFGTTPIGDAKDQGHPDIATYLEQELIARQQQVDIAVKQTDLTLGKLTVKENVRM